MKRIYLIATVFSFIAILSVTTVPRGSAQSNGRNALVGSWQVQLIPQSGSPGFQEMMTFGPDGTIVESNNFPFFVMGITAGPGHGSWAFDGSQHYPFTFIKFLFTTAGAPAGTLKVAGTLTYSKESDSWSGPATVSMCDVVADNCTIIDVTDGHGTRISARGK